MLFIYSSGEYLKSRLGITKIIQAICALVTIILLIRIARLEGLGGVKFLYQISKISLSFSCLGIAFFGSKLHEKWEFCGKIPWHMVDLVVSTFMVILVGTASIIALTNMAIAFESGQAGNIRGNVAGGIGLLTGASWGLNVFFRWALNKEMSS